MIKSIFLIFLSLLANLSSYSQNDTTLAIYFDRDAFQISESDKAHVEKTVNSLRATYSITKAKVSGFCDDVNSDNYNLILSQKRAQAAAEIIISRSLLSDQEIEIMGKGEVPLERLKNFNSESQRAKNRKSEITFYLSPKVSPVQEVADIPEPEITEQAEEPVQEFLEPVPNYLEGDLEVGDKIILKGILFVGNQDVILDESLEYIQSLLQELNDHPEVSIQIQGHIYDPYYYDPNFESPDTDNLSAKRAKKVYKFLKSNGIDKKRLSFIGFEGKFPLGGNPKFDRRVEIEITSMD